MITKNIYTVRVLEPDELPMILKGVTGKLSWFNVVQPEAQWSAEAIIPDFAITDIFDLDIIFDDDFRKTTDISVGDRLTVDFGIVDKRAGLREVEVLGIRYDKPINHLQNSERKIVD